MKTGKADSVGLIDLDGSPLTLSSPELVATGTFNQNRC